MAAVNYFAGSNTNTVNDPGFTDGRGLGLSAVFSGAGSNSAVDR